MADRYVATQDAIATGTSLKTLLEIGAPSSRRLTIIEWWIEFDGASPTAVPVLVDITRASATITGTTYTPLLVTPHSPAALATAKHTSTGEGTPTDVIEKHRVHPQGGYGKQYPLGREIEVAVSTFIRIRVTAAATVNAAVGMVWEE